MIQKYHQHCSQEPSVPLFSQAWWLDATAGPENWGAALVTNGEEVMASMPYVIRKRHGLTYLDHPPLTQTLGPWFRNVEGKPAQRLARQKDWMESLIEQLPRFDRFAQNWPWQQTNWLPFYWKRFQQTTRYTYILSDLSDPDSLWNGLQENIRREIKKARNRFNLRVREDLTIDDLLTLNKMTFNRQGMELPYSDDFVRRLDEACVRRNARRLLVAEDAEGRHHAGVYVVWDANAAYYLIGGGDPDLRNSGATSLCMWEAIRFAATVTRTFDFEGSMLEPVERFFRAFGATQTPYFAVSKTPSRVLKTVAFLRDFRAGN